MARRNIYEERFDQVSDSRVLDDDIRQKLVEGLVDLNGQKKIYAVKQKEFSESDIELSKIRAANRDLKASLVETLIQKEELISQKKSLVSAIEMLKQHIDNLEKETNILMSDEEVEQVCNRFSCRAQQSLLNKILDAKCKLLELGVPLSDINNSANSE